MNIPEGWPTEEMIQAGLLEMLGRPFDKMVPVRESVEGIFKAMLQAAPTPPAQDEPMAWYWEGEQPRVSLEKPLNSWRHEWVPLYAAPQSDKLRQAAKEYVATRENAYSEPEDIYKAWKNLRAALERKCLSGDTSYAVDHGIFK